MENISKLLNKPDVCRIMRILLCCDEGKTCQELAKLLEQLPNKVQADLNDLLRFGLVSYAETTFLYRIDCGDTLMPLIMQSVQSFEAASIRERAKHEQYNAAARIKVIDDLYGMLSHARSTMTQ